MTRAWLVALLLPVLATRASADVRLYGMVDFPAGVAPLPGVGIGVELGSWRDSLSLDASGGGVPICFGDCVIYAWAGASVAYHHQLTDRIFVGPRIGAIDRGLGAGQPPSDIFGWATLGVLEVGFRRPTNGWIASASLGAGASMAADRVPWPAVSVRVTYGR